MDAKDMVQTDFYKLDPMMNVPICLHKYLDGSEQGVKVHLVPWNGYDSGITGFFSGKFLLDNFKYNEAYIINYEKDYGDGAIAIRSFLSIIVDSEETVERFRDYKEGGN